MTVQEEPEAAVAEKRSRAVESENNHLGLS